MSKQTKSTTNKKKRLGSPPVRIGDEQPLLSMLVREAHRRSHTLVTMAKALGVSYARVAQWRRGESLIRNSRRPVFEHAARYLGLPTLYVLIHADVVRPEDFLWPGKKSLEDHLADEMVRVRQDRKVGPFVPAELDKASQNIRLFVAFLFHQLKQRSRPETADADWLEQVRAASEEHVRSGTGTTATTTKADGRSRSNSKRPR